MLTIVVAGNRERGDDAAGLLVADRLPKPLPDGVRLIDAGGDPIGILDELTGADRVLVIDAVRTGASAGTIHRMDGLDRVGLLSGLRSSTHGLSVMDVLELAKHLDLCPNHVTLIGIEGDRFTPGPPSAAVERAVAQTVAMIGEEVATPLDVRR